MSSRFYGEALLPAATERSPFMDNPFQPILNQIPGATLTALFDRVRRFEGRRLLALGDLMLDEYVWGEVTRISPESPVPVVEAKRNTFGLGGAGNVVKNLRALGGEVAVVGILGDDATGETLERELRAAGADVSGLYRDPSRPTTSKMRVIAHSQQNNQQIVRIDRESRKKIDGTIAAALLQRALHVLPNVDAVLISDYNKGIWVPALAEPLLKACRDAGKPAIINPKPSNAGCMGGATLVSMNHHDAALTALSVPASHWENGPPAALDSPEVVDLVGRKLRAEMRCETLFITQGGRGLSVFAESGSCHLPAIPAEVYDGTGAGDTVVSIGAMTLASGGTPFEAAALGIGGGALKVHKLGAVAVSKSELQTLIREGKIELQGAE
jgi:D-beta-D-heptose 7-phosphate kinase/D-beta-D-heptose 1-phosphate adenosyltransferase